MPPAIGMQFRQGRQLGQHTPRFVAGAVMLSMSLGVEL